MIRRLVVASVIALLMVPVFAPAAAADSPKCFVQAALGQTSLKQCFDYHPPTP